MALSNSSGALQEQYDYNDFGAIVGNPATPSAAGNPYFFNGRRLDTESGLYNYRTRYMDPELGRFTTRDSIGIWGDPMNLGNGYTYTSNNPMTFVDPFGKSGGEFLFVDYMESSSSSPPTQKQYQLRAERDARSLEMLGTGIKDGVIRLFSLPYTLPAGISYQLGTIWEEPEGSWYAYQKWWEDPIGDYVRNNPTPDHVLDDVFYGLGTGGVDALAGWGVYKVFWLNKAPLPKNYMGKVDPPLELLGKNRDFGNKMHELITKEIEKVYPDIDFDIRVKPNENGIDITIHGPEDQILFGYKYADIKPRNRSGENSLWNQIENTWHYNHEDVLPITYEKDGTFYKGFEK